MPYMKKQVQWISRTVMVKNNDIDEAMQILNGIMSREGMLKRWRGTRCYEKPTQVADFVFLKGVFYLIHYQTRQRVNYEKCKAIYDEDMSNKVRFIMRKNRTDPYPGC